MTPKEKAKEIFDKMYYIDDPMGNYPMCFDTAKQCALIAVDEMLKVTPKYSTNNLGSTEVRIYNYTYKYWEQVKQEIEAL